MGKEQLEQPQDPSLHTQENTSGIWTERKYDPVKGRGFMEKTDLGWWGGGWNAAWERAGGGRNMKGYGQQDFQLGSANTRSPWAMLLLLLSTPWSRDLCAYLSLCLLPRWSLSYQRKDMYLILFPQNHTVPGTELEANIPIKQVDELKISRLIQEVFL